MFWFLMFLSMGILSVAALNPVPIAVVATAFVFTRPVERKLQATIVEAGRDPELPPAPRSAMGCAGCALWFVVMGLAVLMLAGVCLAVIEGKITP